MHEFFLHFAPCGGIYGMKVLTGLVKNVYLNSMGHAHANPLYHKNTRTGLLNINESQDIVIARQREYWPVEVLASGVS